MERAEVESNILGGYPKYLEKINYLIELCVSKATDISIINPDWISNNDARFAIYGKYVSTLNATKILLYNTLSFVNQDDWVKKYNDEFAIGGRIDDFVYLKELDTQLRFANYMSFVSEFESSLLIIIRFLKDENKKCAENYTSFITDNLKIITYVDFLRLVRHLRNSIHNNGIHMPTESKYNSDPIKFKGMDFNFQKGERIDLKWIDCFVIYEELIGLTEIIFNEDMISRYELITDIVLE
ncbi:hypothetical protein LV84_00007 [Algoriphagus ratkowskyi]|uniref:Uncharacterized protein n=1 Tax=Algoriphagus ratkowskyi TaxID=57028 RepID=A0A2W7S278_9BACT|nr:hypothetical protein [Algoriphagus ratkowskyi]PZX61019.1 hypothetical protein LV84_00007 [Algoriphagus ratkowskyi]TXD79156.1 hypothetical protein ESW18_02655 [Algoriphagus ratkowskyi]